MHVQDVFSLRKPKDIRAGLSSGGKSIVKGIGAGVVGLVAAPALGAHQEGFVGFAKGAAAGRVSCRSHALGTKSHLRALSCSRTMCLCATAALHWSLFASDLTQCWQNLVWSCTFQVLSYALVCILHWLLQVTCRDTLPSFAGTHGFEDTTDACSINLSAWCWQLAT